MGINPGLCGNKAKVRRVCSPGVLGKGELRARGRPEAFPWRSSPLQTGDPSPGIFEISSFSLQNSFFPVVATRLRGISNVVTSFPKGTSGAE